MWYETMEVGWEEVLPAQESEVCQVIQPPS